MFSVSTCHLPIEGNYSPIALYWWDHNKTQKNTWAGFCVVDAVMFSQVMIKVASMSKLTYTSHSQSYGDLIAGIFCTSSFLTASYQQAAIVQEVRVTGWFQRNWEQNCFQLWWHLFQQITWQGGEFTEGPKLDPGWTAENAYFRNDQVSSQLLGCLNCVRVHRTLYKISGHRLGTGFSFKNGLFMCNLVLLVFYCYCLYMVPWALLSSHSRCTVSCPLPDKPHFMKPSVIGTISVLYSSHVPTSLVLLLWKSCSQFY